MAEYELVREIQNSCSGNQMRDVFFEEIETDDPEAYLADKGFQIPFATDTDEDIVFRTVGGSGTLPQTIVLNRKGEVIYNQTGSVTPEKLAMLYDEASR